MIKNDSCVHDRSSLCQAIKKIIDVFSVQYPTSAKKNQFLPKKFVKKIIIICEESEIDKKVIT